MTPPSPPVAPLWDRPLAALDTLANRLYGERANPLYQSGTIAVFLFLVLLVTGLWLLLFYRVGAPWASVARLQDSPWLGSWVRALHRYASDAAIVAIVIHLFRMYAQGRVWGPRALAWLSGVVLLGVVLILGWTGYVMVWDTFGRQLAIEGARMFDALPFLSERLGRTFVGERPPPPAFFFINLFLHIALPLGLGVVLWIHVSRIARPVLLPPVRLRWIVAGTLAALSVLWPAPLGPEGDAFTLPREIPVDLFYAFWLPWSPRLSPAGLWALGMGVTLLLASVPWWPRRTAVRPPSVVDERLCTGCVQCTLDCPYGAISMLPRDDGRATQVARVDPALCVSCGICAGSCAPMGVGPPGRTGRDQLEHISEMMASRDGTHGGLVVFSCLHAARLRPSGLAAAGAMAVRVDCAGSLHTSAIEYALRAGARGVLVLACPPRDCWNREGPRWLDARIHHQREAELQARVDRRRVRIAYLAMDQEAEVIAALHSFTASLETPTAVEPAAQIDLERECESEQVPGGAS